MCLLYLIWDFLLAPLPTDCVRVCACESLSVKVGVSDWLSWRLRSARAAAAPLYSVHPCWIKNNIICLDSCTHTRTHALAVPAAEMSEEVKEKTPGKTHRKKKGKKVKDSSKPDALSSQWSRKTWEVSGHLFIYLFIHLSIQQLGDYLTGTWWCDVEVVLWRSDVSIQLLVFLLPSWIHTFLFFFFFPPRAPVNLLIHPASRARRRNREDWSQNS